MTDSRSSTKRVAALKKAREDRTALPTLTDEQVVFAGGTMPIVHWCDWSGQPDIHYACGISTTPAWGQPGDLYGGNKSLGFLGDDGSAYVFDEPTRVTCQACRVHLAMKGSAT